MTVMDLTEDNPAATRRILVGHETPVTSWDIQNAASVAVTRDENGTVRLWDLKTISAIASPVTYSGAYALSPDQRFLAVGSQDGSLHLLDLSANEPIPPSVQLRGSVAPVTRITFSPDRRWIAATKADATELWNLSSGKSGPLMLLRMSDEPTHYVQFSADSRWLVIQQGSSGTLYNLTAPNPRATVLQNVAKLVLSPDGRWLVAESTKASPARLWKLASDEVIAFDFDPEAFGTAFSFDGRWLFTSSSTGSRLWDLSGEKPTSSMIRFAGDAGSSPDGRWFIISNPGSVVLLDLHAAKPADSATILPGINEKSLINFSPDGRWLLTSSHGVGTQLWDLRAANPTTSPTSMLDHDTRNYATFSRNSRWLVTSNQAGTQLWDLAARRPTSSAIPLPPLRTRSFTSTFSPDGRWLFVSNLDTELLLDLAAAKPTTSMTRLPSRREHVPATFSSDNRWLLIFPRLWELEKKHSNPISAPVTLPLYLPPTLPQAYGWALLSKAGFSPDAHWIIGEGNTGISLWSTRLKEDLLPLACRTAGRNLTKSEWDQYFPGEKYHQTCCEFPPGEGAPSEAEQCPKESTKKAGK
jgi:WD40 repeat protein